MDQTWFLSSSGTQGLGEREESKPLFAQGLCVPGAWQGLSTQGPALLVCRLEGQGRVKMPPGLLCTDHRPWCPRRWQEAVRAGGWPATVPTAGCMALEAGTARASADGGWL